MDKLKDINCYIDYKNGILSIECMSVKSEYKTDLTDIIMLIAGFKKENKLLNYNVNIIDLTVRFVNGSYRR